MSKMKPRGLLATLFSKGTVVLSTVACSYLWANVNITEGINSSGVSLQTGEENSSIGAGIAADATNAEVNTTISAAVKAGEVVVTQDSNGNNHYTFYRGDNSRGEAIGVDINQTGVTFINSQTGVISASAENIYSYGPSDAPSYPDVNNTELLSVGVMVNEDSGAIVNLGAISATATLNNDANNSEIVAVGLGVTANIDGGIVNFGTITGTAKKVNTYQDENGTWHSVVQKTIGGHTGIQGEFEDIYETGEPRNQSIDRKYAAGIYNIQEQEIRSQSEAGRTQLENDFKRVSPIIYDKNLSNSTVIDTVEAEGIHIESGKSVTGGIEDHGYISSVLNEAGATIEGKAGGGDSGGDSGATFNISHTNGITITPGALGITSNEEYDGSNNQIPSEEDINKSKEDAQKAQEALEQYKQDLADYLAALDQYQKDHPDAVENLLRNNDENRTQDTSPEKAKYYNDGNFSADLNTTAIEEWLAQQANVTKPTPPENNVSKPEANVSSASAPQIDATPITEGSKTARIGDIINLPGATIKGAAGGHGIEIRATSGSNISSLLTDSNDTLDANLTNNAHVTSGHASAYLGEGSPNRTISHDANGNVVNTLIGGLKNLGDIKGDGAISPILLNANSDTIINTDDNNSDNVSIFTVENNGTVVPIRVNPSSTVALGQLINYDDGTIQGGAGANGLDLIVSATAVVNSNNDGNITGGRLEVAPSAVNAIGQVLNAGKIEGGAGAAGIGMLAETKSGINAENGQINDANISVNPVMTNRIDLLINDATATLKGGLGGFGIKSEANSKSGVKAKDINNSSDLTVKAVVSSTFGDIYNLGSIPQSLGQDAIHITAKGEDGIISDSVESSKITVDSVTTGGIRVKGNSASDGNLVNGGTISAALSKNAINISVEGSTGNDALSATADATYTDSNINVKSTTIGGIEGDFSNIATALDENRTKTVYRGTISAALSQDAALLTADGETNLELKNISDSTVYYESNTTGGVGGNLTNGGKISVALSKDAIDLSSTATTTAHNSGFSEINASNVATKTYVRAGIGGDFINGSFALESGEEKNATSLVDNAVYTSGENQGEYIRKLVIAAEVNENNTSDVNSSGAHTNPLLTESDLIYYHDREDALTDGVISVALAHDGVKFTSDATNNVTPKLVTASTLQKDKNATVTFNVQNQKSNVESVAQSDARVRGNFINNGSMTVALSHRAVNSETTATGTLGDIGNTEVVSSSLSQSTLSIGGVGGNFENRAISSKAGAGVAYTELSGNSDNSKEVPRIIYSRANNANKPVISSALADDAINLSAKATNEIKVKSTTTVEAITNSYGSGSENVSYSEGTITSRAHLTKSSVSSTTEAISGIGGDFRNSGKISVALAKNGLNAEATGNSDTIDGTGATKFKGTDVTSTMVAVAGIRGDFINDVESLESGDATILYKDVYNPYTLEDGTVVAYSPKYYQNTDDKEGQRVKSNVIDSNAVVYSKNGRIDTDGFVYSKDLSKGEMTAALAKSPVKLDASTVTTIKPASIGSSEVNVVTLHTNYVDSNGNWTSENNASKVDFNTTAKVVSNVTENSTVTAGIGGKFTNKNKMSSALAAEVVNVAGEATSNFGDSTTSIEGGEHSSTTLVRSGIGNGIGNSNRGFLNAADVYDTVLATDTTKVRVGHINETDTPLLVDANANDYLDENATTPLKLIDSKTIAFWNKELVVAEMKAALAKDVIKADGVATTNLKPTDVTAATGVLTKDNNSSITLDVVGSYVDGRAKTKITQSTTTLAGIGGDFTNQGKMSAALSKQILNTESTATTNLGDNGVTNVVGSELSASTTVYGGVQGNFRNEVLSFDLNNGEAYVDSNAYDADPKVAFDKTTTVGQVVMSTALSAENINLRSNATNTVDVASASASEAVKYTGAGDTWDISQIKSDAISAKAKISSTTNSTAGIKGDFYNSGKISAALSKEVLDGTTVADNILNAGSDKEYLGTDIVLNSISTGGIQGSFTNDALSLDTGAKEFIYKDVLDVNGNPTYYVYHGKNTDNDSSTTNDNNISDAPIAADGTRVKSNVVDRVIYDKEVVTGEMSASLSKELVKLDATATNTITPAKLGESDVNVVRVVKPTGDNANSYDGKKFDKNETIKVVSNLNANTSATAGIGERFTNKSKMTVSLSKDLLSVAGKAETNFGNSVTEITGGIINDNTTVLAGIGNKANAPLKGFINIANTYDKTKNVDKSKINSGDNDTNHLVASNNEHDANVDENTTYLNLIDSKDVVFWDKELVVGEMSASLSKEVIKAEAVATATLKPKSVVNATNDVNLTAKDTLVAVDGYKVAGDARADVSKTTNVIAGINGGFYNQGKITSSLSKDVLNAKAKAEGVLGDVGATEIEGAKVSQTTIANAGIKNGDFRNEALSFDLDNGDVYTQVAANGVESAKVVFAKKATIGEVEMSAATSGGADVVRVDASATNTLDAKSIEASDAVTGNNGLESAKTAQADVLNQTYAFGGIGGNFYNNQKLEAATSLDVISAAATSDNDLGTGAGVVKGSTAKAISLADATINGNFLNDAKLLDDGAVTNITYKKAPDGNDSNVVDTITYEQKIAKGEILSTTAGDALHMIATGNNDILLDEVGNKQVTVANVNDSGVITGASSDYNVSSNVTAANSAITGIRGQFINKGDIKGSSGKDMLNFQAVGGASTVTISKVGGGSVTATNEVISGINLDGKNEIAFENKVTDFNTVLKTDENYDASKVVTGTIEADTGSTALNFVAIGGAKNDVNVDSKVITAGQEGIRDIASISNTNTNQAVINGKFINEGDIIGDNYALNFSATNEALNDVHDGNVENSGMLHSVVNATVKSYINGSLNNSGTIKTNKGVAAINLEAIGGKSEAKGALADVNSTEYASAHNITISDTTTTTKAYINGELRNSGTIEGLSGAKAIALSASGTADSSSFDLGAVSGANSGKVLKNKVTAQASIASIYNIGEIKTADATVIDLSSTASAKTSAAGDETKAKYEDTTANITASIGDIVNDAYTYQNKKKDVNKAFNGGVQLHPTEDVVKANGGEYDFASFHTYNATDDIPLYDAYHFSTGTKVAKTLEFNTTEELNALAYNDNNTSDNPVLSQKIGKITTGSGPAAISVVATATDSEFTNATAKIGNVLNRGIIDGGSGKGIYLSSTGDVANGAVASATAGQIYNAVTDNTFESKKEGTLHSIIIGEIKGGAGAIKLEAVGEADQNVSKTVVDQIVNSRVVLHKGDKVITMKANGDDLEAAITSTDDNYDITTLDEDEVYLAVIGSGSDKLAIDIGENAHVTNGIHNYGKISGNVHLGDAKLYLYGLVETNTSTLSNNIQMTQAQLAAAADFEQAAGIVDSTEGITNSYAGSAIIFEGAHLFNGTASGHQIPAMEADEIIIDKNAVVNIADDQAFDVTKATDIYHRGLKHTFVNRGILNVAAGKKVDITGDYRQEGDGIFVSNMIGANIVKDENNTYENNYGQLNVSGNADLKNGIKIVLDGSRSAQEWKEFIDSNTRIEDIVTASTLSVGDKNITHEGEHTNNPLNVKVTDNSSAFDFKVVEGSKGGGVDLVIVKQAVTAKEGGLTIDTPYVAIDSSRMVSTLIDTRIDSESGYHGAFENDFGSNGFIASKEVTPYSTTNYGSSNEGSSTTNNASEGSTLASYNARGNKNEKEEKDTDANLILSDFAGFWLRPFGGHTKQKATGDVPGYTTNTYGLTAGIDKRFDNWFVGFALTFAHAHANGGDSTTNTKLFEGTIYGSRELGNGGILNLQLSAGYLKNKRSRYAKAEGATVNADYDGYIIQAKATYEKAIMLNSKTLLYPYVSAELLHAKNDGYTESGPSTAVMEVGSAITNSAILSIGAKAKFKLDEKSTLIGRIGVGYDFGAKRHKYNARYVAAGIDSVVYGNKPGKFEYNVGLGYQTVTNNGTRIKFMIDHKGRSGYHDTTGSLKFYIPFN